MPQTSECSAAFMPTPRGLPREEPFATHLQTQSRPRSLKSSACLAYWSFEFPWWSCSLFEWVGKTFPMELQGPPGFRTSAYDLGMCSAIEAAFPAHKYLEGDPLWVSSQPFYKGGWGETEAQSIQLERSCLKTNP